MEFNENKIIMQIFYDLNDKFINKKTQKINLL
jgi:hypothetical protein